MNEIINKAQHICIEVKNHSKLFAVVKEEKEKFNKEVDKQDSNEKDSFRRPCLPRTAVLPSLKVATRIARAVRMLKSYLRVRKVLQRVITIESFYNDLFQARGTKKKEEMKTLFIDVVQSDEFFNNALDVYHILTLGEAYLRIFDRDDCLISDVYRAKEEPHESLTKLPVTLFFDQQKRKEVLNLFLRHKSGDPTRDSQVKLLADIHYAAHLLDPSQWCLEDDQNLEMHSRVMSHVEKYLQARTITDEQRKELGIANETDLRTFLRVRSSWQQAYHMQNTNWKIMICYKNSPSSWWKHLALSPLCSVTFQTFALRTLDVSPSSCAVERSFKAQKHIRSDVRNRLGTEKVHKIMFSSWNYSLMNREKEEVRTKLRRQDIWAGKGELSQGSASEWLRTISAKDNVINSHIAELTYVYRMDESSPSHEAKPDRYLHEDSFEDHEPDISSEGGSNDDEVLARALFHETSEFNNGDYSLVLFRDLVQL